MKRPERNPAATRERLVTAAVRLILRSGYHATGVDAICEEAGVTKGSFFHHFSSKEELGRAVISWWSAMGTREYSEAWADEAVDPLDQLLAMFDIMEGFASGKEEPCVCVIGMMAQELSTTHPEIRQSCAEELAVWTGHVARLLKKAAARHQPSKKFHPEQVAWFFNSIWQGSMLLAKTREDPRLIVRNLDHARAYLSVLFPQIKSPRQNTKSKSRKTSS